MSWKDGGGPASSTVSASCMPGPFLNALRANPDAINWTIAPPIPTPLLDPRAQIPWSPLWKGVVVNVPLVAQQFDASRTFSFAADTAAVSVPVFIALGRYDFAVPYTTWEGFRGPFRDLTVHIFDGAGHYPQLEAAAEFDQQLLAWLRR